MVGVTLRCEGWANKLFPLYNVGADQRGQLDYQATKHCYHLHAVELNGFVQGPDKNGLTRSCFKDGDEVTMSGKPAQGEARCHGLCALHRLLGRCWCVAAVYHWELRGGAALDVCRRDSLEHRMCPVDGLAAFLTPAVAACSRHGLELSLPYPHHMHAQADTHCSHAAAALHPLRMPLAFPHATPHHLLAPVPVLTWCRRPSTIPSVTAVRVAGVAACEAYSLQSIIQPAGCLALLCMQPACSLLCA